MCGPTQVQCQVGRAFATAVANGLDAMAKSIGEAAVDAMNGVATFWINQPAPVLVTGADTSSPQNSTAVAFLQGNLLEITAVVFFLAVVMAGIRTAWEHRAEPLQQLLKATMIFVVVSGAGAATMQLLSAYSDDLSTQIMTTVHPDQTTLGATLGTMVLYGPSGTGLLAILVGVFVIIGALIQVILLMVRSAMLIILAGTFPLAAAATNTEIGRNWFKKYCGWALGFLAYKPAAALIYAAAMKMNETPAGRSGNSFVQTATGLMMLLLAIFALPALLRFMVPLTSAVAGGSSGSGTAVADPGGMATGALNIGRSGMGKSAGAGGGAGGGAAGGATGAAAAGPVGLGVAAAGASINGARKLAGGVAGAAAHSAGEAGGGSTTPTTPVGPMSRRSSGSRSSGSGASGSSSPPPPPRSGSGGASGAGSYSSRPGGRPTASSPTPTPEPTGPSGAR